MLHFRGDLLGLRYCFLGDIFGFDGLRFMGDSFLIDWSLIWSRFPEGDPKFTEELSVVSVFLEI